MKGEIGVFDIILMLGTIQGFILSLALFLPKREIRPSHKFLALFLLLISCTMLGRLLLETSLIEFFPNFLVLPDAIIFLYGPLMYLYLRKLLVATPLRKAIVISYFIPAILFSIVEIPLLLSSDHYLHVLWLRQTTIRYIIIEGAAILHNVYFFILQCSLFIKYKNESEDNFSYKRYPSFWVLYILIAITLVAWMISYFGWTLGNYDLLSVIGYRAIWITLPFITYSMGYFAMRDPDYLKITYPKGSKYKKAIPQGEKEQILDSVINAMEERKLYKDPTFSLSFLSDSLIIERNKLSQLINHEFKKNFNDWTNDYRINESKSLLGESNLNIKEIYFEVGFNSKSAFNTAFKKKVGMTPTEFRRKHKIQSSS